MSLYEKINNFVSYQPDWGNICLEGKDVKSFLQGQTSNDVNLPIYSGQFSTILDSKSHIKALLFILRIKENKYFLLAPNRSNKWLQEHFNKFIIMESLSLRKNFYQPYLINGLKSKNYLKKLYPNLKNLEDFKGQKINNDFICKISFIGGFGSIIFSKKQIPLINKLDRNTFEIFRLESGLPFYGQEFNESNLLQETGLQSKVISYNKGCFIGQEIVARIKSRGNINRFLIGIIVEKGKIQNGDVIIDNKKVGYVVNHIFSPFFKKQIAYAYLNKKTRQGNKIISVQQKNEIQISIHPLPFITNEKLAKDAIKLFEKAMKIFTSTNQQEEVQAINLLRQAINKNPKYADAYESLGVILSRHQQYDEAISLMKQLKELNPLEVMAYSNLSIFYMKKGMIKEAEDEKAQATIITFQQAAAQRKKRINKNKISQQNKEKMAMFKEVLKLDNDDLLANFSLGKLSFDLGYYKNSRKYLEKTITLKKNYSISYLILGKCLTKLQHNNQAKKIWQKGIQIANDNGDLMPAKEMQQLLNNKSI